MNFKSKEMRRLWSRLEKVYFNIEPTIQKTVQNNETYIVKKECRPNVRRYKGRQ